MPHDEWRVAMVVPLRGPAGLFAPSCEAVIELAVDEVNAHGGILGREVVAEIVDGGDRPDQVAADVRRRVDAGDVQAVSGWHISSVREALVPVLAGRVPYAYPSLYEGGESRRGVFCSGETPDVQIAPALRWMRDELGARRWFVVGDDYVWPHLSARAVRGFAHELDLDIVGEAFVALGAMDVERLVDRVERAPCDGVLMLLVGQDAVDVNREFARRGLDDRLVRFSPLMEENMVLATGAGATRDLYASAGFFEALPTTSGLDFSRRYTERFGVQAPVLGSLGESCYEGVTLLARLAERAGGLVPGEWDAAADALAYDSPRGTVRMAGNHLVQSVYLARAEGLDLDVLAQLTP
jgi:urea transport system substrate-binding protein